MIEPPRGILETPIGAVNFTMTEAGHVYLNSDGNKGQAVTIRGIPYHVSYHCHLVAGQWTAKDIHDPYLNRKDKYQEASQAARDRLTAAAEKCGERCVGVGDDGNVYID